jgi:quinol monooxygenase YgiN
MIAFTVTITTQPGRRDEVMALMGRLVDAAAAEPGTLVYAFHTIDDEPDAIVSYELFADADALAAHQQNPIIEEIVPQMRDLVVGSTARRGAPVVGKGLPA